MISRNPHDPDRPERTFSKTFMMADDRFRKSPVTLLKISKKCDSLYRIFKKKVRGSCRTFGKKPGHDPGIPGKILPLPGVLVRLTPPIS
jgi:hypothetical protein